ncbi:hypothetical protein Acr_09g0010550 [Actinidia rufa]|uniref:Nucleolar 27S pre-rRNA processing Urb2/Npa2 C-terminal domain-containing protein n=1 Tax=Actinidia rufa TaxID=165716 RepID=A0A7J0F8U2_9ERIC|nr:hypothetical protein Acr_09g0010550 [Actinidia rufa]
MADFESEAKHKSSTKKKRKLRSAEGERDEQRPSKAPRMDRSEKEKKRKKPKEVAAEHTEPIQTIEYDPPWRNLQLMLSLQNKDIDLPKKVELAYGYVKLRVSEEGDDSTEGLEVVSISRVMVFLNNWVQSLLISSEKKIRAEGYKIQTEIVESCLDYRCWEIFKYCLEESLKLHVSLSFSRDFLRVIHFIARDALSRLNGVSSHSKEMVLNGENLDLYSIVIGCVSLVFSSHGGVSNENVDLWILTADSVFELVQKNFDSILDGGKKGVFVLQFSCVVIEPFAKFLRIHPTRKNGFRDFIDKLLEPLLRLLDALHLYVHRSDSDWIRNLLKFIEEVVSHGLFHSGHMDGFLSLQSTGKYMTFEDGKPRDLNIIIKSYHRLLFDKLEMVLAGKSVLPLRGVGELFRLFVNCVKNQKAASVRGGLRHLENDWPKISSENINVASEKSNCSSLRAETRKSLFDFFVQIMEPFLQELNVYLQAELEVGPVLFHVHNTLSCINKIILSFMHEKLYLRTEDTSEGAFFNFLKVVYDMVLSFFTKFMRLWPSPLDLDSINKMGMLNSVAKELVLAASHLVEIEYEVVGNDLERLWLMMFKFVALGLSLPDAPGRHSLTSEILHLGCQLVNLYSELRQVSALRRLVLPESWGEMISSTYTSNAPSVCETYAKSVSTVLCSQEFRLAIHDAVVSIPEGQVSGTIQQLKTEISESLEWVKISFSVTAQNELGKLNPRSSKMYFDLQAELLGRCLSDMHTLVLDYLTVTAGNSNLIRVSVKDLMTVLRHTMNSLVAVEPDSVHEFLSRVTGRSFNNSGTGCKNDLLSTHWVLLFFFRLYMSCRSLYRQALSLVPPDTSRKMSEVMGDSVTAYSGKDWVESTDWTSGGYFSWILQPSASLFTIIQSVSDIYLKETTADCAPLVYVLNIMAVQRLVDLNRLIMSFEYLLQRKEYLVKTMLMDDVGSASHCKNNKKLKKCLLCLRQEAADLTNFMMGHLPFLAKDKMSIPSSDDAIYESIDALSMCEYDKWDFGVGALNEKSLPSALCWIICQSIDVWCTHAAKKKLKIFLSLLIQNSLLGVRGSLDDLTKQNTNERGQLKNVTARQISLAVIRDTVLYEQRFVRRLMASRFCRILEKSILAIFTNAGQADLKSSPNSPEFLSVPGNSSLVFGNKLGVNGCTLVAELISGSSKRLPMNGCEEQNYFLSHSVEFTDCHTLLNFLCWMPKGYANSKSLSLYATYILNIERLVVGSILECQDAFYFQNLHDLFRLLLSCRRALKNLFYCILSLVRNKTIVLLSMRESSFDDSDPSLNSSKDIDAWKAVVLVAETLKEQTKNLLVSHKESCSNAKVRVPLRVLELLNLSAIISCSQGFMWGLASALDHGGWSLHAKDHMIKVFGKKGVRAENADCVDSILAKCDSFDLCGLKKSSLQGFLRGENPEAAYFLRQIFMASSALLRLNLQIKWTLSFSSVPILFGVSYVLLVELASKVEVPSPFSFVWLDGIAKFLEELGSYLPIANPILSRNLYVKMVELHLMAIGKCIALQGKRASLASHDTESSTKTLDGDMGLSESLLFGGPYYLDEFKASSDGGNVSSIVAAGIDCLDLVLEFVTGRKRSSVVKRHIQSLVACLFNIILHLQGPLIFYANLISNKGNADPDPGSVILMCVEVLTRVFGKHAMYQLDSCQVGQALRIPAAIFQNLFRLRVSEGSAVPHSMSLLDNQGTEIVGGVNTCVVDRQFLIDLFAACCRLLSTVLKQHHKSETEQCFALLEDSVSVLLHCLEMVDTAEVVRKNCFAWEILEAVKCASFLRRIYEEMRQQKDVFGRSCSLFLSDYIRTYSGFGPLKTGIKREIDEALRPGVYALIDACSADDLQRLHTLFGEGPCRSTLTALQHDYKLNFQYEGKV